MNNKLLTTNELVEYLKITEAGVRSLRRQKAFPFYKIGNSYRYKLEDIEKYFEKMKYVEKVR